jgi:hypothetical protein
LLEAPGTDFSRAADRARIITRISEIQNARRDRARAKALAAGLPARAELPGGRVIEIESFDGRQPVYLTTQNTNAAISTGANLLRVSPYSLSGSGVTIGMWDGGSGRATHQEFGTRMVVKDGSASLDHATHVGGTLAATGVIANARGMANSAIVDSYDWNADITEMTSRGATATGQEATRIYLSNHSYGYISGWNYVGNTGTPQRLWEWYGSGTDAASFEDDFGRYNTYSRDVDSLAFNAPYYLVFQSAGNERSDNPSNGQTVALAPGSATVVAYDSSIHPKGDGSYRGGFESMGFRSVAKNVITVGATTDAVSGGLRSAANANITSFSSWGPTDDGRIKPDVVANGDSLYSSLNGANNAYGNYSGTSMSTPNACGSAALLVQQYGQLFPGLAMRSATLKALLIHTADDRGHAGPDYKFGWGLINVTSARSKTDATPENSSSPSMAAHGSTPDRAAPAPPSQATATTTPSATPANWPRATNSQDRAHGPAPAPASSKPSSTSPTPPGSQAKTSRPAGASPPMPALPAPAGMWTASRSPAVAT